MDCSARIARVDQIGGSGITARRHGAASHIGDWERPELAESGGFGQSKFRGGHMFLRSVVATLEREQTYDAIIGTRNMCSNRYDDFFGAKWRNR
jgi:hypothetical protein